MARRLDIELTSDRGDGQWTWRAAGAKQPKGTLDGSLVPSGVGVGDVVISAASADIKPGNAMPLSAIPVGTIIHNVELKPEKGAQIARSAGSPDCLNW